MQCAAPSPARCAVAALLVSGHPPQASLRNAAARQPLGGQRRRQSSISLRTSMERMSHANMSVLKKIPDMYNVKVPNLDMFQARAQPHTRMRNIQDRRSQHRMLKVANREDLSTRPVATKTFESMQLHGAVHQAIWESGVSVPSNIQQTVVPMALKGKTVMMCSATGTGKTLAFMIPLFHRMLMDRAAGVELRDKRPRAVIFAPSFELCHQIWGIANRFAHVSGMRAAEMYGSHSMSERLREVEEMFDILVTTPGAYQRAVEMGDVVESDIKQIVFDEADVTVGGSLGKKATYDAEIFHEIMKPLLKKQFIRDSYLGRHKVQFYLSSNCLTKQYTERVRNWIPHAVRAVTDDMHVAPRNLLHRFIPVTKTGKYLTLMGLLSRNGFRTDREAHERQEKSKKNFWFPDAITFETGEYSPLDQGSWATAKHDDGVDLPQADQKRLLRKSFRQSYLKEYDEDYIEREALPAPSPKLLLPGSMLLSEISSQNPPKPRVEGTPGLQSVMQEALVPVVKDSAAARSDMLMPTVSDGPDVVFGPVKLKAAPFTGLPGLLPTMRPAKGARTIIFVSHIARMKEVAKRLMYDGVQFAVFGAHQGAFGHSARVAQFEKWATGEVNLLLTTELAARGLDHPVHCVINYDVPAYTSDYLLRVGRAGRMGRQGTVFNLVDQGNSLEKRLVLHMEHRLARGKSLEGMGTDAAAFRTTPAQWWKKKRQALTLRWAELVRRGFINKEEERKMAHQTLNRAFTKMPNPRDPLGRNKANPYPKKLLAQKHMAFLWKLQYSTKGTGDRRAIQNPLRLWREKVPGSLMGVAKNVKDPRANLLLPPVNRDKMKARMAKYGMWAEPMPINRTKPVGRDIATPARVSRVPSAFR